jgi:hypothetical protein
MTLKTELIADVQRKQQRMRELRDMTQDRDERVRLDDELAAMQITLSDLESMDEEALRTRRAEQRRARRASARSRGAQLVGATIVIALAVAAVLSFRSRR